MRTGFIAKKVLYSADDEWLIILDSEGNVRVIDWRQEEHKIELEED